MEEKIITDRIEEVYHFMQYGKLMPGVIHNFNGKYAMIDSKIQLATMKLAMKRKKLEANKENISTEVYEALSKEYDESGKLMEGLNKGRTAVNDIMQGLNSKVSNEFSYRNSSIDLCSLIKEFDNFFYFYKRYKHNTTKQFEFDGTPFIKMKYKDIYFLLFVTVKNCVDATFGNDQNLSEEIQNIVRYKVVKIDGTVELRIFNNGKYFENFDDAFTNFTSDKISYDSEEAVFDTPEGVGLDLYFLKKILDKYKSITYRIESKEGVGTEYIYTFPKL